MKRSTLTRFPIAFAVVLAISCASIPAGHSTAAELAFKKTQVIKALDVVRDTAIAANAQTPPLVSTDATRKIVLAHQSALQIIAASANGWPAAVDAALSGVVNALPAHEQAILRPYLALVQALLKGIV